MPRCSHAAWLAAGTVSGASAKEASAGRTARAAARDRLRGDSTTILLWRDSQHVTPGAAGRARGERGHGHDGGGDATHRVAPARARTRPKRRPDTMSYRHWLALFAPLALAAVACKPPSAPAQPSSATILFQETFEDDALASRGWYDNLGIATTTAEHVSGSTRALEAHFPAGATTPTWGGAARHLFTETESVYLSYWVKYSANWVGSGQLYHPHEFLLLTNENDPYVGPSFTHLTAYVEHNYQNGGIPVLALQ